MRKAIIIEILAVIILLILLMIQCSRGKKSNSSASEIEKEQVESSPIEEMSNEVIDLKEGEVQEASQEMSFESQQEVQEDAVQEGEQEASEQEPVEQSSVEQSPVNQVISKQEENDSKKEAEELSNLLDSFADASDDQKNALLEDAIARARKILQTNPSNDAANYFVAQDELKKRNYELAMQALQRAIEFNKRNYLYYYAYLSCGDGTH